VCVCVCVCFWLSLYVSLFVSTVFSQDMCVFVYMHLSFTLCFSLSPPLPITSIYVHLSSLSSLCLYFSVKIYTCVINVYSSYMCLSHDVYIQYTHTLFSFPLSLLCVSVFVCVCVRHRCVCASVRIRFCFSFWMYAISVSWFFADDVLLCAWFCHTPRHPRALSLSVTLSRSR
jgi:hypothetical protein